MQDYSDPELIEEAKGGNMMAFRVLVERNQTMAYSIAFRFLQNQHDAEDISQEAFVRIWKNMSNYRPGVKVSTWLYKIVTNLSLDMLKSKYRKQSKLNIQIDNAIMKPDTSNPQQLMENHELSEMILQLAQKLTPKQQSVFILRDVENLEAEEVGIILSMNKGAIKSNLFLARAKMHEMLNTYYEHSLR